MTYYDNVYFLNENLFFVLRDNTKLQETLKVEIESRKYKRFLIFSKEKRLFVLCGPRLITGALYCSVLLTMHACFAVLIRKGIFSHHISLAPSRAKSNIVNSNIPCVPTA